MPKPGIIVLSEDDEDTFRWLSDGWHEIKKRGARQSRELMSKAKDCIDKGENVPDVIQRLTKAGFRVERMKNQPD